MLPLDALCLIAADLGSLRLRYYEPTRNRYELVGDVVFDGTRAVHATISQSGTYSLMALPADPLAQAAIGAVCSLDGYWSLSNKLDGARRTPKWHELG